VTGRLQSPSLSRNQMEHDNISSTANVGNVMIYSDGSNLEAQVTREGRVNILFSEKAHKLSKYFQRRSPWAVPQRDEELRLDRNYETSFQQLLGQFSGVPHLNIAIHIVGSRGDVQPFVAIGQILTKPPYGHRVRLCTHPVFKDFVEENGLEFFSIGGDPTSLMAYMVKNPGLLPGRESWKTGEVGKRRAEFAIILEKCWRSCIEAGNGMGGGIIEADGNCDTQTEDADRCFIADAIIANPPSYGHVHCAEKLGIPLHMMFTYILGSSLKANNDANIKTGCHGHQLNTFLIPFHRSKGLVQIQSLETTCRIQ
jgi:sterol 3beta-glucosyltransferase